MTAFLTAEEKRVRTLNLQEAAMLLGLHPDTLRERAAAAIIPGAKIGRAWRFLESDLIEYFRSRYTGERCRSTSAATSGGSRYATAADEYTTGTNQKGLHLR